MAKRPKRVLVLGGTGHVGQAVVRHALESGQHVTVATRQSDPIALRGLAVTVARLDDGWTRLAELAAGHDLIVDAAAPYSLEPALCGSSDWKLTIDTALRHAELVLDAARRNRVPLAFVSSFTTLPRDEPPFAAVEAAWRRSVYPYFEAKAAMESAILRAAAEGLPTVIVNPTACLGPWEFRPEESSFVRLVLARRLPLVIDQTICVVDVRDVAAAIDRALVLECFGRPIALGGHNLSVADLAFQIARLDGAPSAPPFGVDRRFALAAALWTQATFAAFSRAAPNFWRSVPLIADAFPMQPSPAQIGLGLSILPLASTLCDAVAFHRQNRV